MTKTQGLALITQQGTLAVRHLHPDTAPLERIGDADPVVASAISAVDQRLDEFLVVDDRGVMRSWRTARRCECGFEPYTEPWYLGRGLCHAAEIDYLCRAILATKRRQYLSGGQPYDPS